MRVILRIGLYYEKNIYFITKYEAKPQTNE